jgi:hypothetical protein
MNKPLAIDFHSRSDKSGSDFRTKIDQRFPDQNRIAIFILKSDPEFIFSIAIMIPIKNRSGKIADRFSFQNQIPFFSHRQPDNPPSAGWVGYVPLSTANLIIFPA